MPVSSRTQTCEKYFPSGRSGGEGAWWPREAAKQREPGGREETPFEQEWLESNPFGHDAA